MGSLAALDSKKVVVITGATSGIGHDLAERLHARGYNVAMTGRRVKEGEALAAQLDPSGKTVLFMECHVESYASQVQLFKAVWAKWERIDAFIANAGMIDKGSRYNLDRRSARVDDPPPEPSLSCTDVDFKAVVYSTELFVHYARHNPAGIKPKIIVTGSIIAIYPCPTFPEYSAVKAAALQWVRTMAPMLLKHENITINTVLPNAYDTGIMPDFKEAYLDEHLTGKECLMLAYDIFLEDEAHQKTGQAVETAFESHYFHDLPEYKSGNVIERTDKPYEPWFQWMHHAKSELPGAYLEPLPRQRRIRPEQQLIFPRIRNELKPSCIARPSSTESVQSLIKALSPRVSSGEVQVAIRGGGHTPFAGSANINGGVTIDLRPLKGVALSDDKSTVTISAGETWTSVYQELEKHGLTVTGGRVGRIGGLSMFSGKTGFACDSVIEFEVVLSSGELVRASAKERKDLWIALKGGLNNFGVVTSFKMKTIKSGDIWGGVTYYMPGTFAEVLQRACDFVHNETDNHTHIMCSAGYGFGHQAVTCVMYHTGGIENPPSLQRFTSIEPQILQMNTMRIGKHLDFCEELSKFSTDGGRQYWASITVKPDINMMEIFHDKWQEALAKIKDAEDFIFSFGFHPLTKTLLENSAKAGGNAMDISPSDGPLFVILVNPIWTLAKDDDRVFKTVGALVDELRSIAFERGLLHRYIFTNYGFQADDIVSGYGEESVSRLRETSKKYDPKGMFQNGVPGGFKLPK